MKWRHTTNGKEPHSMCVGQGIIRARCGPCEIPWFGFSPFRSGVLISKPPLRRIPKLLCCASGGISEPRRSLGFRTLRTSSTRLHGCHQPATSRWSTASTARPSRGRPGTARAHACQKSLEKPSPRQRSHVRVGFFASFPAPPSRLFTCDSPPLEFPRVFRDTAC